MTEISNKVLVILALIVIIISIGGTWLSLNKLQALESGPNIQAQAVSEIPEPEEKIEENKEREVIEEIK